jgi:hypothetical protein
MSGSSAVTSSTLVNRFSRHSPGSSAAQYQCARAYCNYHSRQSVSAGSRPREVVADSRFDQASVVGVVCPVRIAESSTVRYTVCTARPCFDGRGGSRHVLSERGLMSTDGSAIAERPTASSEPVLYEVSDAGVAYAEDVAFKCAPSFAGRDEAAALRRSRTADGRHKRTGRAADARIHGAFPFPRRHHRVVSEALTKISAVGSSQRRHLRNKKI